MIVLKSREDPELKLSHKISLILNERILKDFNL